MNDEKQNCDRINLHTCPQCGQVFPEMYAIFHTKDGHVGRTTFGYGVLAISGFSDDANTRKGNAF